MNEDVLNKLMWMNVDPHDSYEWLAKHLVNIDNILYKIVKGFDMCDNFDERGELITDHIDELREILKNNGNKKYMNGNWGNK